MVLARFCKNAQKADRQFALCTGTFSKMSLLSSGTAFEFAGQRSSMVQFSCLVFWVRLLWRPERCQQSHAELPKSAQVARELGDVPAGTVMGAQRARQLDAWRDGGHWLAHHAHYGGHQGPPGKEGRVSQGRAQTGIWGCRISESVFICLARGPRTAAQCRPKANSCLRLC